MKILLVNPVRIEGGRLLENSNNPSVNGLGLGYVAGYLARRGHETCIYHFNSCLGSVEHLDSVAKELQPKVVGISILTYSCGLAFALARHLRELLPTAMFMAGGHHATFAPHHCQLQGGFDFVVRGPGAQGAADLVERLMGNGRGEARLKQRLSFPTEIPRYLPRPWEATSTAFAVRDHSDNAPLRSVSRPFTEGSSDRFSSRPMVSGILTSFGCSSGCTFCSTPRFWGGYFRRTLEALRFEIESLCRMGVTYLKLLDDSFGLAPSHHQAVCRLLGEMGMQWECSMQVCSATPTALDLMAKCGCKCISFGVESPSVDIARKLGKRERKTDVYSVFRYCKVLGIEAKPLLILGLPDETEPVVNAALNFISEINPRRIRISFLKYLPGTALFDGYVAGSASRLERMCNEFEKGHVYVRNSTYLREIRKRIISSVGITLSGGVEDVDMLGANQ